MQTSWTQAPKEKGRSGKLELKLVSVLAAGSMHNIIGGKWHYWGRAGK